MNVTLSFLLAAWMLWLWRRRARTPAQRFAAMFAAASQAMIGIWQLAGADELPLLVVLCPAMMAAALLVLAERPRPDRG